LKQHYFFIFILLSGVISTLNNALGQTSLQLSYIAPTGDASYELKPGIGYELTMKIPDIDSKFKIGASIGYYSLQPTQDTFRTYATGGSPYALLPGWEVIHSYQVIPIGILSEFAFLDKKKFSPVIGLDVYFNVILVDEDDYTETLVLEDNPDPAFWQLLIQPRAGARYILKNKFLFSAGIGRCMGFVGTIPNQAFWKTFISFGYQPTW
jgi:hypothetical protein